MNFRFASPEILIWLLLVPLLWTVTLGFGRWQQRRLEKSLGPRMEKFLTRSRSPRKRWWKLILQSLALAFLILAWARPQLGESKQEVRSEGVEILLAVDVSDSMMAEDVKPSRLEQAKIDLARLVDLMPGNRTGVLAFAGSAALLSPLTNDPAAVKMYLESLSTSSISSQGTCFECALKEALAAFERGGVSNDDSVRVTRVILIASDGEDHEQGALEIAKQLTDKGVRIFALAYGTQKGGSIPVRDGMGYLRGYKKDQNGQVVVTQVKGDALKAIAEAGKGRFDFASYGGDHLKRLLVGLNELEKAQFETSVATQYDERYQIPLFLGLLFLLMDWLVGERRGRFTLWKGRFEVPAA